MEKIKTIVEKRISAIDPSLLCSVTSSLEKYGVALYNKKGEFVFDDFKKDCTKTSKLLFKNDKPINGIRCQLCEFMSLVQVVVGIRNMNKFIGETK